MSEQGQGDRLVRHGVLLLGMAQVANLAGIAFHMLMGRQLTVDEYGILGTLLNMFLVLASPLDALRNAMAHFTARAEQEGNRAGARALYRSWMTRMLALGLPAGLVLLVAAPAVASFFHFASPLPIWVAGALLPVMLCAPVVAGILQGLQAFVWMGISTQLWIILRLFLGLILVFWISATAVSAIVSHAVAMLLGLVVAFWGLTRHLRGAGRVAAPDGVAAYFLQSMLLLAGYGVLMNSDVMLVRHYHPESAGFFAQAATIGRSVIFLPMPIAMALFPKVISSGATSSSSRNTLGRALLMVLTLIGTAVALVWLLPWLPLRILYGVTDPTPESLQLVRWVCLAMSPLGVTYLLLHVEMAQHRFATVPWLLACASGYIGAVAFFHANVFHIVAIMGGAALASAALFVIPLLLPARSRARGPNVPTVGRE